MSKPYKKFEKAIARLETYPTVDGWSGKALARNLKNTFEALVDVIEQEQSFRLSHPKYKPTGPWDTISSKSDIVLSAHKGWAYRVIDTADSELESKGTLWDNGPEAGVLNRSRMELLRTHKTFAPAKNLWLARIIHSVLRGIKKLWNARPRLPKTIQEPEKSVFDFFESLQFKNDPMSALDAFATAEPNMPGALLLKPEEAGKHGVVLEVPKKAGLQIFNEFSENGDAGGEAECSCGEKFSFDLRSRTNIIGGLAHCPKCGAIEGERDMVGIVAAKIDTALKELKAL